MAATLQGHEPGSGRGVLQPRASSFDFSRRAEPDEAPEWMDEPCSYEEFRACLRDLGAVNRVTLAYRPTLEFVSRAVVKRGRGAGPLRVLDVGSGGGDTLRRIASWAKQKGVAVSLTGVDLNPYAARVARELAGGDDTPSRQEQDAAGKATIEYVTADVFALSAGLAPDIVISSLVTHHLSSDAVVRFVAWMEATARMGWFVNDLLRSERSYKVFAALSRAARWHAFVQHDGLVSIRRAFRAEDWQRLCAQAGLADGAARVVPWFPGRLCVERLR